MIPPVTAGRPIALRAAVAPVYSRGLLRIVLVFVGIVASYRDFIPYWDANVYFSCIADAVQKPFDYPCVLIAAACGAVVRTAEPDRERVAKAGSGLFLSLVLLGLVYAATRFRVFSNARYVLVVSPVLIVAFYRALLSVVTPGVTRRLFLSITAVLVFLSNFRTFDVGSKPSSERSSSDRMRCSICPP